MKTQIMALVLISLAFGTVGAQTSQNLPRYDYRRLVHAPTSLSTPLRRAVTTAYPLAMACSLSVFFV